MSLPTLKDTDVREALYEILNGTQAFTNLTVATQTPASAAAAGVAGTIAWDASFIYVCIATNTWTKVAIASW